jgi:hypothetical protein
MAGKPASRRRPGSEARREFERLLFERLPGFEKAPGKSLTLLSRYVRRVRDDLSLFLTFQNDKNGQARFTIELGWSRDGALPLALGPSAQGERLRLRLGALMPGGGDRWWDLRPELPPPAEREPLVARRPAWWRAWRKRSLADLPPTVENRKAYDVLEALELRSELLLLLDDDAYAATIRGAALEAIGAVERHAAPYFERLLEG